MGQHHSMTTDSQEQASTYLAQQTTEAASIRSQSQRETQSHSPSHLGLAEQNSNWLPPRQMGARKNGITKESPASVMPITTTNTNTNTSGGGSAAAVGSPPSGPGSRSSRYEADLGRMSVREAIDSFIESRLSAPNDSPPLMPLNTSHGLNGLKGDDSRSSGQGDDPTETAMKDTSSALVAEDFSLCSRTRASEDFSNHKDASQSEPDGKEGSVLSNDPLNEESERMSDKELIIDCDASESPKVVIVAASPPSISKDRDNEGDVSRTLTTESQSAINLSEPAVAVNNESKDETSKDSDNTTGDDELKGSSLGKQEKQTFSAYLQGRLKAQLASHVDNETQSHLYLWDVHKPQTASSAAPLPSTVTRTGSVRLQTLIDKVLDQSIGKGLGNTPADIECNSVFDSLRKNTNSSPSPKETRSTEQSPSTNPSPSKSQDIPSKSSLGSFCFKDHIEKVVVEKFLSYEKEEQNASLRKGEGNVSTNSNSISAPDSEMDAAAKTKRDGGGMIGSDGTISAQNIVDRVIIETEVVSQLLTPGASDQAAERVSPGRNSGRTGSTSSPSGGSGAATVRNTAGSHGSNEGQRGNSNDNNHPSVSVGRKRGRPRLSSPVNRPSAWPNDHSSVAGPDRANVFRDHQSDYRGSSSSQLATPIHGRSVGSSVPQGSQSRPLPGQGPPPLDIIASQGSIQHGIPVGAFVAQQVSNQMYHSQLHPHHPHAQHPSGESSNSAPRPMPASIPPPQSPHHNSYQRALHHPSPHPHLPQPPSPHGHHQHHHRPSDHLQNHHPSLNKPLPPLIHANQLNEKAACNSNVSAVSSTSSSAGSGSSSSGGNSRLVPVSHIPTASCSCSNCVAIFSRDKPPQAPPSSLHQQHIRRGEVGVPYHTPPTKLSDHQRDDPRPHPSHPQHPFSVFDGVLLSSRGEQLVAPAPESLKPIVGVGGKTIPPQAIIPSFVAARRPVDVPLAMEAHARDEHYFRDGKPHFPYPPQSKPPPADMPFSEDERHRGWPRPPTLDPHSSDQASAYHPLDQTRRAAVHVHRRQSPEKAPNQHPQPLDLQKSGFSSEAVLSTGPPASSFTDQPLDLSVKLTTSSDPKHREIESKRQAPPTLRNEAYPDHAISQRPAHVSPRDPDPRDVYSGQEGGQGHGPHGRPAENSMERSLHPGHPPYPHGHPPLTTPPSSHHMAQYPQHVGSKDSMPHPSPGYSPRGDGRGNVVQSPPDRPYPTGGHLLSPANSIGNNSRESPTHRSRHAYAPYPLSSSSPSVQLAQQQVIAPHQQLPSPHPTTPQPPGLALPTHLRGTVGTPHGNSPQFQRRSPYSDLNRQPKPQDPRAPSPHYPNVGSHRKTPDTHVLAGSQESVESRGGHSNLPPPQHPQPVVSPDDAEAMKHCVSKHEPIQNIIGNHPQNDILYLICKICRQTYGSPYGFRKHFRNQHGFEPKTEHTIVQTISATKTAMAHTGPGNHPVTDAEKKGIVCSEAQGHYGGDISASYKQDCSSNSQIMEKHLHDAGSMHIKSQSDHKPDLKGDVKLEPKLEDGMENTKYLECPECGQTFQLNDFGSYKRHCRQHSANQCSGPFSCHDCQKSFAEPNQLQQHLNTHKTFTPSLCGFCPTFFSSPQYLSVHLRAAHGHVVPSESLKKSPDDADLKTDITDEKSTTLDLHSMIETALIENNVPHSLKALNRKDSKAVSSSATTLSSSHQEHTTSPIFSSITPLPLSKRHRVSVALSDAPVLTTVHTPKKLEVQKLPADAVVTTASPDSSFEESKGQAADSQPRPSSSGLKSGYQSPSNCSNGQSEKRELLSDSQDSNSNLSSAGGTRRDDNNKSRPRFPLGQSEVPGLVPIDKTSNKDDTDSITSDRCQSVDSNSQSVGDSRTSSPGGEDADKFYKHKKYSRHRKRMSSSDVPIEPESKTPKLSSSPTTTTSASSSSVSSSNATTTVVQVCESSSGHCDGKSFSGSESSSSQDDDRGNGKTMSKTAQGDVKSSKEARQDDNGKYGGVRDSSKNVDGKKGEGCDAISKFMWERLTRSQTGKSPQTVSYSNS